MTVAPGNGWLEDGLLCMCDMPIFRGELLASFKEDTLQGISPSGGVLILVSRRAYVNKQ